MVAPEVGMRRKVGVALGTGTGSPSKGKTSSVNEAGGNVQRNDINVAKLKEVVMNRLRLSPPTELIEAFIQMYTDAQQMALKYFSE